MDWTLAIVGGWGRAEDRWLSSREFHDNPHRVVGVTADQKNSDCRRRAGFSLESGRGRHRECPGATTAPTTDTGGETSAPAGAGGKVGVSMPTQTSERWIADGEAVQQQLQDAGFEVDLQFANDDIPTQSQQVARAAAIQLNSTTDVDRNLATAERLVDAAAAAGIKVISYDRLITGTDAVDFYVTFDSVAVGKAQAQYLVDRATGTAQPLYLYAGAATDNNAFLFFEGAWT